MIATQPASYPEPRTEALIFVSRKSWDEPQRLHQALPGSRIEHVLYGTYVLIVEPGGARKLAARDQ